MVKQIGIVRLLAISLCLTLHLHTINAMEEEQKKAKEAEEIEEQHLPPCVAVWFEMQDKYEFGKENVGFYYIKTIPNSQLSVAEVNSLLTKKMQNPKLNADEFIRTCVLGLAQFATYHKPTNHELTTKADDNTELDEDPSSSSSLATTISGYVRIAYKRRINCTCYTFPTMFLAKTPSDEAACVNTLREMVYDKISAPHLDATKLKRACAQGLLLFTLYYKQERFKELMGNS